MTTVAGRAGDRKLPAPQLRELCRDLALEVQTQAELAGEYGISRQYVTKIAREHKREIKAIREAVLAKQDAEFAGLWIAQKELRIAAYLAEYEASLGSEYADHFEQRRTRMMILRNVAEELGSLPNRNSAVIVTPVVHVVVGDVDLSALE